LTPLVRNKNPAIAGGVFRFKSEYEIPGVHYPLGMVENPAAAPGKVCPLARPQVVGITPSGFRVSAGRWADAEQSTSPKIGLLRLLETGFSLSMNR
jgi:hypothetical protein